MSEKTPTEVLRVLRRACVVRDSVVASGARDQLNYAMSQYHEALELAGRVLETASEISAAEYLRRRERP